jgi:hypothetical protein
MLQYPRRKHRAPGPRRAQISAGLTALGTAAILVTVVLVVTGGVISQTGALTDRYHRHHPIRPIRPTKPIKGHPTRTAPTGGPTTAPTSPTHPTTGPTTHPTTGPTTAPTSPSGPTDPTSGTAGTQPDIGVYMAGNNSGLDSYTSSWRVQPNAASFYLNFEQKVPALMKTYAAQGRQIQVALQTKISSGSYATWTAIAKGTYDSQIVTLIKSLDALNTRVLLSLDVEPDANITGGGGVAPGQTPAQYVAAANHFADLIHANSKRVQSLVWLAGFKDAATEASFLPAASKLDNVGWDPYMTGSYAPTETATALFSRFINNVLVPYGYGSISRHILETGIKTDKGSDGKTFDSQTQVNFFDGVPAAMKADDISSVIWFRDDSGSHNYIPTDSAVDRAFAAMVQQLLG